MEIKASAKITMKTIQREIDNSQIIKLLQEANNMIEELVEHIEILEKVIEEKEEKLSLYSSIIDDLESGK